MRNILLAISGLTPQIVTESLYVLAVKEKIEISEIYIITTRRGEQVLQGKDKSSITPNISIKSEISELCNNNDIKTPRFSYKNNVIAAEEESTFLYDVRTDEENILFPNKAAEVVKKLTEDDNVALHVSIAGGRKSMSAHLALVMSLFARSKDKLYHILTDEKFEFGNFYPKTKGEENALILAELPFVKLRSLNNPALRQNDTYYEIVQKTQERLDFLTEEGKLVVELRKRIIRYKNQQVSLSPIQIVFYVMFVEQKINYGAGYTTGELQATEFAARLKDYLEEYYNQYFDTNDKKHWAFIGLQQDYVLTLKSKINAKLKNLFVKKEIIDEFKINSERKWGATNYLIRASKEKLGVNYE